jgi:glycosyltransferase involved in cell wall biosynthesis
MKVTDIVVKLLGDLESHFRIEVVARSGSAPIPAPLLRELDLRSAHTVGDSSNRPSSRSSIAGPTYAPAEPYEPFALTVAEALAGGIPVVGRDAVRRRGRR